MPLHSTSVFRGDHGFVSYVRDSHCVHIDYGLGCRARLRFVFELTKLLSATGWRRTSFQIICSLLNAGNSTEEGFGDNVRNAADSTIIGINSVTVLPVKLEGVLDQSSVSAEKSRAIEHKAFRKNSTETEAGTSLGIRRFGTHLEFGRLFQERGESLVGNLWGAVRIERAIRRPERGI